VAEHYFSNPYGIMPDVFMYMGYLAAKTSGNKLTTPSGSFSACLLKNQRIINMLEVEVHKGAVLTHGIQIPLSYRNSCFLWGNRLTH
jgi:hypothetical protein